MHTRLEVTMAVEKWLQHSNTCCSIPLHQWAGTLSPVFQAFVNKNGTILKRGRTAGFSPRLWNWHPLLRQLTLPPLPRDPVLMPSEVENIQPKGTREKRGIKSRELNICSSDLCTSIQGRDSQNFRKKFRTNKTLRSLQEFCKCDLPHFRTTFVRMRCVSGRERNKPVRRYYIQLMRQPVETE